MRSSSRPSACFWLSPREGVNRPGLMPTMAVAGVSGTLSITARLWAKFWFIEPRLKTALSGPPAPRIEAANVSPLVIDSRAVEPPSR